VRSAQATSGFMASNDPTWLSVAGTALTGLGATINGVNTLNGLVAEGSSSSSSSASAATAAGIASGTAALASGILAFGKLGTFTTLGSLSALSVGAGCAYASAGFIYLVYSIARVSVARPPPHAPREGSQEAAQYPSPDWLSTRVLNWAVVGRVGVGKSTLINALRGLRARSPEAAPVGVGHTTKRPRPYQFVGEVATITRNMARIWDLPGAGTKEWPYLSYVRDAGLRHFDGVILVTSGAFTEVEAELMLQLVDFKVPYYIARNKVDQDITNNEQDNGASVDETLAEIRIEMTHNGCDANRTFLISAKHPESADYDFGHMLRAMAGDLALQRMQLPEFEEDALLSLRKAPAPLPLGC